MRKPIEKLNKQVVPRKGGFDDERMPLQQREILNSGYIDGISSVLSMMSISMSENTDGPGRFGILAARCSNSSNDSSRPVRSSATVFMPNRRGGKRVRSASGF